LRDRALGEMSSLLSVRFLPVCGVGLEDESLGGVVETAYLDHISTRTPLDASLMGLVWQDGGVTSKQLNQYVRWDWDSQTALDIARVGRDHIENAGFAIEQSERAVVDGERRERRAEGADQVEP